jgi:hypothetical protein
MESGGGEKRILAMSTPTTTESPRHLTPCDRATFRNDVQPHRELDSRTADGITVVLLWRPGDTDVLLRVDDARTGVRFELPVPGCEAREAFQHPFAYAG